MVLGFVGGVVDARVGSHTGRGLQRCVVRAAQDGASSNSKVTLSPRALQLIAAQAENPLFDAERFGGVWATAERAKRFLDNGEFQSQVDENERREAAKILRDHVTEIIGESRSALLKEFPGITEPGGALYPESRSDACWRDFWHFSRVASYGVALGSDSYVSTVGLSTMRDLYNEMQVPLDAMVYGVNQLSQTAQSFMANESQREAVAHSFNVLGQALQALCQE